MIPHNRPTMGAEEVAAAKAVLESAALSQGRETECFENEICEYLGIDPGHAVAVSSGSAALYMALRAKVSVDHGRSVAIPAYSCTALKNAVMLAGGEPIYVDTKADCPNIDPNDGAVRNADVTIVPHMYGRTMKIDDAGMIEDCAQALGAKINGKKAGTQTDIGVFSFYATKPITSGGEGGMVVTRDKALCDLIRDIRDFDMKNDEVQRFNLQMTDLQAAIGRVQLKKLDRFVERRKELADRYEEKGIPLWGRVEGGLDYRALILSKDQGKLLNYLAKNDIRAIIPIEEQELLCDPGKVPNARKLTSTLVSIPLYPSLTETEQDHIIEKLLAYADKEGIL